MVQLFLVVRSANMAFCFQCVSNSEVGVVERLGKFTGLAAPGLNCILWPIDVVSTRLPLFPLAVPTVVIKCPLCSAPCVVKDRVGSCPVSQRHLSLRPPSYYPVRPIHLISSMQQLQIVAKISTRVQQLDVRMETKVRRVA